MKNNNPPAPEKISGLRGVVEQGVYGKGSKSEHNGFYLNTGLKKYLLRRKQGPALGDTELTKYLGHQVECSGFLLGDILLIENITVIKI